MSSKGLKHGQKMARKRAVKAARKSAYEALAGSSKKKKRQGKSGGLSPMRGCHVMTDCGNAGCKRCYPRQQSLQNPPNISEQTEASPPSEPLSINLGDKVTVKGKSGVGRIWATDSVAKAAIVRFEGENGFSSTTWIPMSTIFAAQEVMAA